MKRTLAFLLAMLMCFSMVSFPAFAADEPVITIGTASAEQGEEVEVPVTLSGNTGFAYINIEVEYDAEVLELVKATNTRLLSGSGTFSKTVEAYPYVLTWTNADNMEENGEIATLTFKVKDEAAKSSEITATIAECYDADFDDVAITVVSGKIDVTVPTPEPTPTPEPEEEYELTFAYTLYDYENEDVDATSFTVKGLTKEGLDEEKLAELKAEAIKELIGDETEYYDVTEDALPEKLVGEITVNVAVKPHPFEVIAEGEDGFVLPLGTVTIDHLVVTLPKAERGFKYTYTINGKTYEEGATVILDKEDLGKADLISVTKEEVDIELIDDLNEDLAQIGKMGSSNIITLLRIVEAPTGTSSVQKLSEISAIVARVIVPNRSAVNKDNVKAALEDVVNDLKGVTLTVDGKTAWSAEEEALYVQSVIDAALNSGAGMQSVLDAINPDGTLNELKLNGVVSNIGIPADEPLGACLVKFELGVEYEGVEKTVPLYITIEDKGQRTDELKNVRELTERASGYIDVTLTGGNAQVTLKTAAAYDAYLTAAIAAGYTNLRDVENIDSAEFVELLYGFAKELAANEDLHYSTLKNTAEIFADRAGKDLPAAADKLDGYEKAFTYLRRAANHLGNNVKKVSVDGTTWKLSYDLNVALDKYEIRDDLRAHIAEVETAGGLVTFGAKLVLPDAPYTALIIDQYASVKHKVHYVTAAELQAAINEASTHAAIILMKDVEGGIDLPKNVVLDLNGFTVDGDLTAEGDSVFVFDSTFDNRGGVTGAVTGEGLTITGGTFGADVTGYLPNDYVQEDGVVGNGLYTIEENGKDLKVILNAQVIDEGFPSPKALAAELALDLAMNYYNAAALTVDGHELYAFDWEDMIPLLQNVTEEHANIALGMIDMPGGVTDFANDVIGRFTDISKVAEAIKNGEPITTFEYSYNNWNLAVDVNTEEDRLAVGLTNDADRSESGKIVIVAEGENTANIAEVLERVGEVTEIKKAEVHFDPMTYNDKTLYVSGNGELDVVVDLRDKPGYVVGLAIILANGVDDNTAIIDGIETYFNETETKGLRKLHAAFNEVTTAELVNALRSIDDTDAFKAIVEKTGFSDTTKAKILKMADYYAKAVVYGAKIADRLGIDGGPKTIGDAYETSTDGIYFAGKYDVTKHAARSYRGYTVDVTGEFIAVKVTLKLFNDDHYNFYVNDLSKGVVTLTERQSGAALTGGDQTFEANKVLGGEREFVLSSSVDCPAVIILSDAQGNPLAKLATVGDEEHIVTIDIDGDVYVYIALSGDVTFDGVLSTRDVNLIQREVVNGNVLDLVKIYIADVTHDGRVTTRDVFSVQHHVVRTYGLVWNPTEYTITK